MTVRSVTDPPPSALLEPIIVNNPPFVVTSTTDEPFLARITFEWAGADGQNPPMDVEHWVDVCACPACHYAFADDIYHSWILCDRAMLSLERSRCLMWVLIARRNCFLCGASR